MVKDRGQCSGDHRSPIAALQAAISRSPDLFVTDLMGPDAPDGFDRIRYLRKHPATSTIPILVISGCGRHREGIEVGADIAMRKPFPIDTMIEYVKRLISRNSGKRPAIR